MTDHDHGTATMRSLRFHEYGEPGDVLILETIPVPDPEPGTVRISVRACGLAPADWALCRGLFAGDLPRGIGCDVAGTVDAVGEGVTDVAVGDAVYGTTDWASSPSAGAADTAVMNRWARMAVGLDFTTAAALPMAIDTAYLHLGRLGLSAGQTILINGAGGTVGFAATQIALSRGVNVIATAGDAFGQRLRALGATVTAYGEGLPDRIAAMTRVPVDVALDTAPVGGALPALVEIVGGDPRRVMTISDFEAARKLGVRSTFDEDPAPQNTDLAPLDEFARLAADGKFTMPIADVVPLAQWRTAMTTSLGGHPHGKLILAPN